MAVCAFAYRFQPCIHITSCVQKPPAAKSSKSPTTQLLKCDQDGLYLIQQRMSAALCLLEGTSGNQQKNLRVCTLNACEMFAEEEDEHSHANDCRFY